MNKKFEWENLSKDVIERHFNPRVAVPDAQRYIDNYTSKSLEARKQIEGIYDIRYGPNSKQTLDLHIPKSLENSPLLIFFHGGYWRALDKKDFTFVASSFLQEGIAVANVNYDLCPEVKLDELVEEIVSAFNFCRKKVDEWGVKGIYLAGHSAGAHLVAELLRRDFHQDEKPNEEVKGAILLTGIYEPEVALNLEVNKEIQLDSETASKCNVMREPPHSNCPVIICAGANEPEGWIDQSKRYLELCESKGIGATFKLVEDAHHFSLLDHASDEKHPLFKMITNFCH